MMNDMNRRSFIGNILAGVVAPLILPGAGRKWKRTEILYVPNPAYTNAEYEVRYFLFEYKIINVGPPPIKHSDTPFDIEAERQYINTSSGVFTRGSGKDYFTADELNAKSFWDIKYDQLRKV